MPDTDQIKKMLKSPEGKDLKDFLIEKADELKDLSNLPENLTDSAYGFEAKTNYKARMKIKKILEELLEFETSSKGRTKDKRDNYHS